jgi:hypothetical protein
MTDLLNPLASPILVAKYGQHWRWTLNPAARRAGNASWSATSPEHWCEVADYRDVVAAADTAGAAPVSPVGDGPMGALQRLALAHRFGHCNRRAPHWPTATGERLEAA